MEPVKPYHRSKLKQTAAALNGVPSWNFTPRRRRKVHVRRSLLVFHFVASFGTTLVPPWATPTRPSSIWLTIRGVFQSPSPANAASSAIGSTSIPKTNVPPLRAVARAAAPPDVATATASIAMTRPIGSQRQFPRRASSARRDPDDAVTDCDSARPCAGSNSFDDPHRIRIDTNDGAPAGVRDPDRTFAHRNVDRIPADREFLLDRVRRRV